MGTSLIPFSSWLTKSGPKFWWCERMCARYRSFRGKSDVQPITWHRIFAFMWTVEMCLFKWFFAMYWLLQYWHWYFLMFEWEFMWWFNSDCVKYLKWNMKHYREQNLHKVLTFYRIARISRSVLDDDANGAAWGPALKRKACRKRGTGCADCRCGWFDAPSSSSCYRKLKWEIFTNCTNQLRWIKQTFVTYNADKVLLLGVSQHVLL